MLLRLILHPSGLPHLTNEPGKRGENGCLEPAIWLLAQDYIILPRRFMHLHGCLVSFLFLNKI